MQTTTGRRVGGRYRLDGVLGAGGMATVYRARDELLGHDVAVKLYAPDVDLPTRRRFQHEATTLGALSHPGLVEVRDSGVEHDQHYLVLRLIEGPTLRQLLADGPLLPDEVSALGARLAASLAYVHSRGVVHRDVKPANILIDTDGLCYLADFGISRLVDTTRLTATGQVLGTAAYLAPEQVRGMDVGPPADVYALGLVLLEGLTGHAEYGGTGVEAAVARLHRMPAIPPDTPPALATVLAAMTALDPADRPDAAHCARSLLSAQPPPPQLPAPVRENTRPRSAVVPARRSRPIMAALGAAMLGVAALTWTALDPAGSVAPSPLERSGVLVPAASPAAVPAQPVTVVVTVPAPPAAGTGSGPNAASGNRNAGNSGGGNDGGGNDGNDGDGGDGGKGKAKGGGKGHEPKR